MARWLVGLIGAALDIHQEESRLFHDAFETPPNPLLPPARQRQSSEFCIMNESGDSVEEKKQM